MCDEREQLIDYVYDECDAPARQRVEVHVSGCAMCQEELAGLRQARQDLLAWDVPEHGLVWRPFAPAPVRPSWRDIPVWAMAAAAGIIFMAGAAGGLATRMWLPAQVAPVAVAHAAPAPVPVIVPASATLSDDDIAKLEARVLDRVRLQTASAATATTATSPVMADATVLAARLAELEDWQQDQIRVNIGFIDRLKGLNAETRSLRSGVELASYRPSNGGGLTQGR